MPRNCEWCNKVIENPRIMQRFCCDSHRVASYQAKHPETYTNKRNRFEGVYCAQCGSIFTRQHLRQIYCPGKKCKDAAYRERKRNKL